LSIPICMWSGPRNLSTAMMRSFGSRADCAVMDEPFFAAFLKVSGKDHPGREETLAAHETDPWVVAERCMAAKRKQYSFQKHMPHHMLHGFPMDWTEKGRHFFLIRDPARVIASYAKGRSNFTLEDLGFAAQRRLYAHITDITGRIPPVIDSLDILRAPEKALRAICVTIDIPFDPAMLSWEAGSRPEDGAWAPYWYKSVEKSTEFASPPTDMPHVPDEFRDMLRACKTDYEVLYESRIQV